MVAVGDGWCVCWTWAVVVICCAFIVSWSWWPFVAVCVHGHCCLWLLWAVMCLDGGGKEKRNHVMLPKKHCLLSMTNK